MKKIKVTNGYFIDSGLFKLFKDDIDYAVNTLFKNDYINAKWARFWRYLTVSEEFEWTMEFESKLKGIYICEERDKYLSKLYKKIKISRKNY